jgi:hypothetical protein
VLLFWSLMTVLNKKNPRFLLEHQISIVGTIRFIIAAHTVDDIRNTRHTPTVVDCFCPSCGTYVLFLLEPVHSFPACLSGWHSPFFGLSFIQYLPYRIVKSLSQKFLYLPVFRLACIVISLSIYYSHSLFLRCN